MELEEVEHISEVPSIKNLHKAVELYEAHPFSKKLLLIRGELALYYSMWYDSTALQIAYETIALAEKHKIDELDKVLSKSYFAIFIYKLDRITPETNKYGELAYKVIDRSSQMYIDLNFHLGQYYIHAYKPKRAIALQEDLKFFFEQPENKHYVKEWTWYYINQANIELLFSQNYEAVIITVNKALAENDKYQVQLRNNYKADLYELLGKAYSGLQDLNKALFYLNKAIEIGKYPPDENKLGYLYHEIHMLHASRSDFETALEYAEKAKQVFVASNNIDYIHGTLGSQAIYHFQLENYKKTKSFMEESLKYGRNPGVIVPFGDILRYMGEYELGLEYLQESLIDIVPDFQSEDFHDNPSEDDFFYNKILACVALRFKANIFYEQALADDSKKEELLKLSEETSLLAIKILEGFVTEMRGYESSRVANNRFINHHLEDLLSTYETHYNLNNNLEYLNKFLKALERKKSAVLLDVITPSELPETLIEKEALLVNQKNDFLLKINLTENKDSLYFYQQELYRVNETLEELVAEIIKTYPNHRGFYEKNFVSLADIQTNLDESTLFIEYTLNPDELFIFAVSKTTHQIKKVAIEKSVFRDINLLNELLKNPLLIQKQKRAEFISVSHRLYQQLILPIASELEGKKQLTIVVDNQLFYLPFEVLMASDEVKPFEDLAYLIKDFDINYQYLSTIKRKTSHQ